MGVIVTIFLVFILVPRHLMLTVFLIEFGIWFLTCVVER